MLAALPRECVRTVEPGALSEEAVALLARRAGRDATEEFLMLHDKKVIPRYAPEAVIGKVKA